MKGMAASSLGNISLTVAIGGLIATEAALRSGVVAGAGWRVLLQAFEAATVGGLADWFAVSALFREVPVPFIRRHTNIIVKNRRRIADGIADMVQNRLLAPSIVREHLEHFSASQYVLNYLASEQRLEKVLAIVRDFIRQGARAIDAPEVAAFLERVIKDQLADIKFAEPLGRWLGECIRRAEHQGAWDMLLGTVAKALRGAEVQARVRQMIARALDEYKRGNFLKRLGVDLARGLKIVNEEEMVAAVIAGVEELVREAQADARHPIRARIDAIALDFADQLAAGDSAAIAWVETLQRTLIDSAEVRMILQQALRRLSATIETEFHKPDSDLNNLMRRVVHERLARFRADTPAQEKADRWVREACLDLFEKRNEMIGQMVRGSLEKLSEADLVGELEAKIGQDLQYIRLNGALVGGFVGALLAIIKLLA